MKFKIEQLDEKTVDNFWRLRKELFLELGEVSNEMDISELKSATGGLYQEGKIVAIGSLCLFSRIPYQENLSGTEGYILNIYTSKHFRKCGFASRILDTIMEYSRQHHIKRLWLSSSEQGKHLYARKGFIKKENEMELFL